METTIYDEYLIALRNNVNKKINQLLNQLKTEPSSDIKFNIIEKRMEQIMKSKGYNNFIWSMEKRKSCNFWGIGHPEQIIIYIRQKDFPYNSQILVFDNKSIPLNYSEITKDIINNF